MQIKLLSEAGFRQDVYFRNGSGPHIGPLFLCAAVVIRPQPGKSSSPEDCAFVEQRGNCNFFIINIWGKGSGCFCAIVFAIWVLYLPEHLAELHHAIHVS
jgi:hypothetical protein